jgi:hypothetical protein
MLFAQAVHTHNDSRSGPLTAHVTPLQVGTIVDEINQKLLSVRMGEFSIAEQGHTIILNWNRHVPPILRQVSILAQKLGSCQVCSDRPLPRILQWRINVNRTPQNTGFCRS